MSDQIDSPEPRDIYELLPWYANGTLGAADAAKVEKALAGDAAVRASLARIEEERGETIVQNEAIPGARSGAFEDLMARIETEAPRTDRSATRGTGFVARLMAAIAGAPPRALALGAFAAALVIVAESGVLINTAIRSNGAPAEYTTASVLPPGVEQAVILIQFAPGVPLDAIVTLLRTEKAVIIDGPKAGGLFRLAVAAADAPTVLADLKANSALVRFASLSK